MVYANKNVDHFLARFQSAVQLKKLRHKNPGLLHQGIHLLRLGHEAGNILTLSNPHPCLRVPMGVDLVDTTHACLLPRI